MDLLAGGGAAPPSDQPFLEYLTARVLRLGWGRAHHLRPSEKPRQRKSITTPCRTNLKKSDCVSGPLQCWRGQDCSVRKEDFCFSGSDGHPVSFLSALKGRRAATAFFQVSSAGGGSSCGFLAILLAGLPSPRGVLRGSAHRLICTITQQSPYTVG